MTPSEAAVEILSRKKARSTFPGFCEYRLPPEYKMALHHRLMAEALDKVERGEIKKLALMLPPGSAKSTYASVLFSEYFLGRNPKLSVIAASHTAELAERFGRRVRNSFADETHKVLFDNGVAGDNSAAGRWETSLGGEYFSAGIGGSITGRRADLVVIDDFVRSREDADSERVREKTWDWYNNDLLTRMKPNARMVIACTRWHEADLLGQILDREADEWTVIKIPMIAYEKDVLGRKEGERLWPEWYTEEMVETAQRDPRSWIALYQQEPRAAGGAEFKRNWIQHYQTKPSKHDTTVLMLVDPASGKRETNDFTSMWVIGLGQDQNYYVLDMVRDRLNLTERAETVFRLHRKWSPIEVRYERYGMMADIEFLRQEMNRKSYRFTVREVAGATAKVDRIRRLIPLFEMNRVWFPEELFYTDLLGKEHELVEEFIEQEFLSFPVGRHDDMLDALARVAEPSLDTPWPRPQQQDYGSVMNYGVLDSVAGY